MHQHAIIPIQGLSCASCVNRLEKALLKHEQIEQASVNLALEALDVRIQDASAWQQLPQWVEQAGFSVGSQQASFEVANITCAACTARIEKVLTRLPGVTHVAANLATNQVQIDWVPGICSLAQIKQRLEQMGYPALGEQAVEQAVESDALLLKQAFIGIGLSLPMVVTMLIGFFADVPMLPAWLQFLLTTPVQFWLGKRFYTGAFKALKNGSANMDVLVALGTSAAYGYSLYLWLVEGSHHLYFEAAAVVISLVMLGKWMEARAKNQAGSAIRKLMNLQPPMAQRWQGDTLEQVGVEQLNIGDEIQVQPGDVAPADGVVVSGRTSMNEAMLTGESLPVAKQTGAEVFAGTQNIDGSIRVRVQHSPQEFRLKQIINLVNDAQMQKPDVQKLVDKVSAIFVPVVVLIALVSFGLQAWFVSVDQAVVAAVSVLVIACPCALGLATPTAIMAASGVGARRGVLIRDINQLQQLARAQVIAFDKTGTLSKGEPVVTQAQWWPQTSQQLDEQNQTQSWVKQVQQRSQHPLARAMVAHLQEVPSDEQDFEFDNISGQGVVASFADEQLLIGNARLLAGHGVSISDDYQQGAPIAATLVWVARNKQIVARFAIEDELRADTPALLTWLQQSQWQSWMLTGDRASVAQAVASKLGVAEYLADLLPEHKAQAIAQLQSKHGAVVMVGDGINDAPALTQADVGIALSSGTDVAMETAGITLMRPDISLIAEAIQLAHKTRSKIWQNLFWAFIYNCIGIPLAALGLLNPLFAGAAMAFSSVCVVSSSLLLLNWSPKEVHHD